MGHRRQRWLGGRWLPGVAALADLLDLRAALVLPLVVWLGLEVEAAADDEVTVTRGAKRTKEMRKKRSPKRLPPLSSDIWRECVSRVLCPSFLPFLCLPNCGTLGRLFGLLEVTTREGLGSPRGDVCSCANRVLPPASLSNVRMGNERGREGDLTLGLVSPAQLGER